MINFKVKEFFSNYLIYLIPLLCSFLFFWEIAKPSLWYDELVTIRTVLNTNTTTFIYNFFSDQLHPPLYFTFLKFYFEILSFINLLYQFLFLVIWANLKFLSEVLVYLNIASVDYAEFYNFFSGHNFISKLESYNEVSFRLPSALFLTAANLLVFNFFKKHNLLIVGFMTCLLIGSNTKLINYAQEARPYALFILIFIMVLREFYKAYNNKLVTANFKKLIVLNTLLLLTHFYAVFVIATEIIFLMYINRKNIKFILSGAVVLVAATLILAGLFDYLNIFRMKFLRNIRTSDLTEFYRNALGYFIFWRTGFFLACAFVLKAYLKKIQVSDRIYLRGSFFLLSLGLLVFLFNLLRPVFNERYLVFMIPLQILIIVNIYYAISEALFLFVKNTKLKNIATTMAFLLLTLPLFAGQTLFHYKIYNYYDTNKYYPIKNAYETIPTGSPYVLEEYQGIYFDFYDKKYQLSQIINLNPDDSYAEKEKILAQKLAETQPVTFYYLKVRHKESSQQKKILRIDNYSPKRIFFEHNIEVYRFTKEE